MSWLDHHELYAYRHTRNAADRERIWRFGLDLLAVALLATLVGLVATVLIGLSGPEVAGGVEALPQR